MFSHWLQHKMASGDEQRRTGDSLSSTLPKPKDLAWRTRGWRYKPWHCYWRIQYLVCNSHFHKKTRKRPVLFLCLPTSSPPPFELAMPHCHCPSCFGPIVAETERQHIQSDITPSWALLEGELSQSASLAVCCTAWLILHPGPSVRTWTTYEVC